MDFTMLVLTIATVILAGLSFWAAVHYGRKAVLEASSANALASERSQIEWYVGRQQDSNPGWFYAANIGLDTAYDVTVTATDALEHVEVRSEVVGPYRSEVSSINADPPGYVEFRLVERENRGPHPVQGPPPRVPTPDPPPGSFGDWLSETRRQQDEMINDEMARRERQQVSVRITWRSELGRWSTVEERTG